MPIKVQKKDGRLDDFDRSKISGGVVKSGVTAEQAENIAVQIESWVQTATVNGVIGSVEIRNKVLELLRLVNPEAAASYEDYHKTV